MSDSRHPLDCDCDVCHPDPNALADFPNGEPLNPPLRPRRPENARHVRLWSPRSTAPYDVICTESHLMGLNTHYLDRRTVLCVRGVRYCYPCRVRIPIRWKGYIGGQIGLTRTPIILEVTSWAWSNCPDLERADGKLFRRWLRTRRLTASPQSKQVVELMPEAYIGVLAYQARAAEVLARVFDTAIGELMVLSHQSDDPLIDNGPCNGVQ
jgi:hypothetical protein